MRIISWNCSGRFKGRLGLLAEYNADVYCIQECESDKHADFLYDGSVHWEGYLQYRGLATFVRRGLASERLPWSSFGACYFLPVRIADKYDLINVWTQQGYVAEWYIYQQLHKEKFHQNMGGKSRCLTPVPTEWPTGSCFRLRRMPTSLPFPAV